MERAKRPDDLAREAAGKPPQAIGTVAKTIGTVKYWRDEKGHGVIASDATAPWDIWCHFIHIVDMDGFRSLQSGQRVEVEYIRMDQESFRFIATRVRRLDAHGAVLELDPRHAFALPPPGPAITAPQTGDLSDGRVRRDSPDVGDAAE